MCALRILQHSLPLRSLLPKLIDHSSVLAFLHKQICNKSLAGQSSSAMAFIHDKEKYLALSLDEKRKVYKSSGGYCTLEDIKTWPSYFRSNQERLVQQYEDSKGKIGLEKFDARPELADKISLWKGDITTLEIDAIVNAANSTLLGGGGVDGAIHRAAGASLKVECSSLNGCKVGEAKITGGYMLPAKYVIHTVGPQGEIPAALQGCYDSCLNLLRNQKLKSIAFPCISTGIYGYPQEAAAKVALKTVRTFMEQNHEEVDRIIFCLFLPTDVAIYENLLQVFFPTS